MSLLDVRHSVRSLSKTPSFTFIAVTTLAIAMAASAVMTAILHAVLLAPLPFPQPERLVVLWDSKPEEGLERFRVSAFNFTRWEQSDPPFKQMAIFSPVSFPLADPSNPIQLNGARVSREFFPLLGVRPLHGRWFLEEEFKQSTPVVIVSEVFWRNHLGADLRALGGQLRLGDQVRTLVGVMPSQLFPSHASPERMTFTSGKDFFWIPFQPNPEQTAHFQGALARLADEVTLEQARTRMNAIAARLAAAFPDTNHNFRVRVIPLLDEAAGDVRGMLWILSGAIALVLAIACANVGGMLLVRLSSRFKEMAIRSALGAGWRRLAFRVAADAAVLVSVAAVAALILAGWIMRAVRTLEGVEIPRLDEASVNSFVMLEVIVVSLLLMLVLSAVPLLRFRAVGSLLTLRGPDSPEGNRVRVFLVVIQTALAVILLIGAALLLQSFIRLRSVEPGFSAERVLTFQIQHPNSRYGEMHHLTGFYDELLRRLEALPEVESAAAAYDPPLVSNWYQSFEVVELPPDETGSLFRTVTPDYFETLSIAPVEGRLFGAGDHAGAPGAVIVNEAWVNQFLKGRSPVGHRLNITTTHWVWGDKIPSSFTIVGVVTNEKFTGLADEDAAAFYLPYAQTPHHMMNVIVRTRANPVAVLPEIRDALRGLDPLLPMTDVLTLEERLSNSIAKPRLSSVILGTFAAIAFGLVLLGIWSVSSEAIRLRTREIGIRLALGAVARDVGALILRQALIPVGAGILIGLLAGVFMRRVIEGLLFQTSTLDPMSYLIVSLLLLVGAASAAAMPARRAMRIEPATILRAE